jgi:hypothetical protein
MPQSQEPLEECCLELVRRKTATAVRLCVDIVHAVTEAYGHSVAENIWQYRLRNMRERYRSAGEAVPNNSLATFCRMLEEGCQGSHQWEKLEESESLHAYRFTHCLWADLFRELGASDIGIWICQGDGPTAAAFNPTIKFLRTKTLMEGDDCCDHVYYTDPCSP